MKSGTDPIARLRQQESVENVLPSFRDADGNERYADAEFEVVQFKPGVAAREQGTILKAAGAEVFERHRTPGLLICASPEAQLTRLP